MANLACFVACALLVAVSAERISPSSSASSSRDRDVMSGVNSFGFDSDSRRPSGSRTASGSGSSRGSSTGSRWDDDDSDSHDSTPKILAWTNGRVPYEITPDISPGNTAGLKKMFQDISDKTCVTFVPKTRSDTSYVSIKSGNKCSAPIGMPAGSTSSGIRGSSSSSGAVANVILAKSCFTTQRVGRRFINLLGIPHETSRPDRDQFVEINMNNLRTGYAKNIQKLTTSTYLPGVLDVPYDLQSVTQYSDEDLAKDPNTWAIRAKGGRRTANSATQLGGDTFSPADFQKINKAYNCPRSSFGGSSGSGSRRN